MDEYEEKKIQHERLKREELKKIENEKTEQKKQIQDDAKVNVKKQEQKLKKG